MRRSRKWSYFLHSGSWGWDRFLALELRNTLLTTGVRDSPLRGVWVRLSATFWPFWEVRISILRVSFHIYFTRVAP